MENIDLFGRSASDLMSQAAKRQQELKDPQLRDDLAAARAILKKHSTMLLTASKVCKTPDVVGFRLFRFKSVYYNTTNSL